MKLHVVFLIDFELLFRQPRRFVPEMKLQAKINFSYLMSILHYFVKIPDKSW